MRAFPVLDTADRPEPASCPVPVANSGKESADDYRHIVARLNARWRVIECRDGLQWILQFGKKSGHETAWRGRSYCRSREALQRACASHAGEMDALARAALDSIPCWIGGRP
jgi:hypothetical protein